jgi:abortive infection bacteriophage resistance protein
VNSLSPFGSPATARRRWLGSLNPQDGRRLYNTLTVLACLLDCISPQHHWEQRLKTLLAHHAIDLQRMGFPEGWERLSIWKEVTA